MAKPPATLPEDAPTKKGPSLVIQAVVLLGISAAAAGTGWFAGQFMLPQPASVDATTADAGHAEPAKAKPEDEGVIPSLPNVLPIQPLTANLASPSSVWARLEVSLVFEGSPDQVVAELIHQDFLAYVRTIRLPQIEGASGLQHLKSDLVERAGIRSGGKVRDVLIRTMLFE